MNILLTTLNAKFVHSSLALRYLRSYAEPYFPDIRLMEYTINDLSDKIAADIYKNKPDVVGFSCYIWNIQETVSVIKHLKKVLPEVKIVLGGPEVTYETRPFMEQHPYVDFVVAGEGEQTFLELLQALAQGRGAEGIQGVVYRDGDMIRENPPRPMLADLNAIPSPYQDRLEELENRIVYFECSRGCPFKCQYCLSSIEDGVRFFEMERVKRDLKRLIDAGVRQIKFVDRTFNIHKQYALEIFQFLIANRKDTTFHFEITADILKPEIVDFLNENAPKGLFQFEIGVQSTNDLTNALVQRRQNFGKLSNTVTKIRQGGKIHQHLDLIAGLPEEDYMSFRKTFNDVYALKPDELQLGFLKMLKGVGVKIRAADHGYVWSEEPPYEIYCNNVLSYEDVLRLKGIEDILERYSNSHKFDVSLPYIMAQEFDTPFDFFEQFADYWEDNCLFKVGHRLKALYEHLHAFLEARKSQQLPVIRELLKLDMVLHERSRQWPGWVQPERDREKVEQIYNLLQDEAWRRTNIPVLANVPAHLIRKNVYIMTLSCNVDLAVNQPEIAQTGQERSTIVVFYDAPHRQAGTGDYFVVADSICQR
ncbi:B12-binding domain-containing radical SAM protein [Effusibacillus lacus]|uniref:B12-binding domain-containing radical SAM protein n=1 Tax=Effusibacillus lacus TaxID=1348429 RepID=A0A292YN02_9BACL|nr:B12-binding domain-containing radical SAM protein [Effusibacillus lacus]TCS71249.1 anaerobic magnesium-protoporphyrin IX monomethyl ester cyclase [Effusibacillus lacus]GAX89875.1 B12-binding domain-containing radical SAM protein [Effusibacillus lacus]